MNILLLAPQPFYQPRGTPIAVRMLAETLVTLGHQVDLLVFHEGEDIRMPGVKIHRILRIPGIGNIRPGFSIKKLVCDAAMFLKVIPLCLRKRYDVIHAVEEAVFVAWFAGVLTGRPYVFDMDSSMPDQIAQKFRIPGWLLRLMNACEAFAVRRSAGVVAVCKSLEDRARGCGRDVPVVRLEDVSLLDHNCKVEEDLRKTLNLNGKVFLYVGNLESYQGIGLMVEAFAIAAHRNSDIDLVVIGGTDADIKHYQQKAAGLGIAERTHFVGPRPVEKLAAYLKQADVLLSPRTKGGNTPMKVYSYLDSGVAVLATDLDTHTQVMSESIACLATPEPKPFAEGMLQLAGDSTLRQRLAEAARVRVAAEFSPAAYARKLACFYRDLEVRFNSRTSTPSSPNPRSQEVLNG